MRQLSRLSGHSSAKIKRLKNYWLAQVPRESFNYSKIKYLLFDGTYFHKNGCLLTVMDAVSGRIIASCFVDKERYGNVFKILKGLKPKAITLDGHLPVMAAVKSVWPKVVLQRCLYHIQREGMRWLRSYPKTEAGKKLRFLLSGLSGIRTAKKRDYFLVSYDKWLSDYKKFVNDLPITSVAHKDLKRTMALINNARRDMFRFIDDKRIESTTNKLEGFYSRLKSDYRRHRGMSAGHRVSYLRWYCYLKNEERNEQIINNL